MTRFHQKVSIAIVVLFMTACINAEAQRTMKGQSVIGAETSFNGISAGATINYSQYTLNGFWYVGISGNDYYALYSDSDILRYNHICGYGGYLFRLVGTRSRSINLYGGGEIIVGMDRASRGVWAQACPCRSRKALRALLYRHRRKPDLSCARLRFCR